MNIKRFFKKFFNFFRHRKNKILCSLTIITVILSMFTVFSSANTVEDDANTLDWVFFPYPNFKGFSFEYDNTNISTGVSSYGEVYNTVNYIYGFDNNLSWQDPNFLSVWEEGFLVNYPNSRGTLQPSAFHTTSRLYFKRPDGAFWQDYEAMLWVQNLWSSDVRNHVTGNSIEFYYEDFFMKRDAWRASPYVALARIREIGLPTFEISAQVTYDFTVLVENKNTNTFDEVEVIYTDTIKDWWYSREDSTKDYAYIFTTPDVWVADWFLQNPDYDYLYITDLACRIDCLDTTYVGCEWSNINLYHYLFFDSTMEEYGLTMEDFLNEYNIVVEDPTDALLASDFTGWINNAVGSFMSFEIFPGFSFQLIFGVLIGALFLFFFLRLFSGG